MASAIIHSTQLQNQQDPSKFYHHFLYKAIIVAIFLVILPLFPEFINQTLLTRNWELLHLLFVGIAISYGLFSRLNDETEKENISKVDNAHSFVSTILHVSSFFEDEAETPSDTDETQFQTWSVQYHRNKPTVVAAPQHSHFYQKSDTSSQIGEKPLLLPVRSLKFSVCDTCVDHQCANVSRVTLSRPTSKSGSKRFSTNANKGRNGGELDGCESPKVEDKMNENIVISSPMPWRSSLMDQKFEFSKIESSSMKSQKSRSSLSSTKELSPSPSFSSETLPKRGYASVPLVSERASVEFSEEEKASFFDKVIVEFEDEEVGERPVVKESGEIPPLGEGSKTDKPFGRSGNEGPDVDKKADEFITKFREQIMLQRVDSIKRSAQEILQGNFEDPK